MKKIQNTCGVTLIETLMGALIFSVILGACLMVLLSGSDAFQTNDAKAEIHQDLRMAMFWIRNDLQESTQDAVLNGSVPSDGSDNTSVTFTEPSGVSAGAIQWSANTVQYVLAGTESNELHRIQGSDDRLIAEGISLIQFTRESTAPAIVEVVLRGQVTTTKGRVMEEDIQFEVKIRN